MIYVVKLLGLCLAGVAVVLGSHHAQEEDLHQHWATVLMILALAAALFFFPTS